MLFLPAALLFDYSVFFEILLYFSFICNVGMLKRSEKYDINKNNY